jgi:hypothetical protein
MWQTLSLFILCNFQSVVTMNVTEAVLENVTDFMTAVSSEDGNALTAILWILGAIILLLCMAASGFGH